VSSKDKGPIMGLARLVQVAAIMDFRSTSILVTRTREASVVTILGTNKGSVANYLQAV
jgi:hypothetical protein